MEQLRPWQRALLTLATVKILIGLALFAAEFGGARIAPPNPRHALMVAHVVVYSGAAALLIVLGRRDLRATVLGVAFALTAAVFADNAVEVLNRVPGAPATAVRGLFALQVDAFTPYFLWFFIQEFPRVATFGPRQRIPALAMRLALALGVLLFVLNIAGFVASLTGAPEAMTSVLRVFSRENQRGPYSPLQYLLSLPALPALIWKARVAPVSEARRVSLLMWGLVIGTAPTTLWVFLAATVPGFRAWIPLRQAGWVLYPTLLAMPFMTAYAVLVHQALNARLIVRRAMRYALARYSVLAMASIPLVVLLVALYRQRESSLTELFRGTNGPLLVSMLVLAVLATRGTKGLLDGLDRRFFREQYDARKILAALVERCRRVTSRSELGETLLSEIDRALHLVSINVLFIDASGRAFESPRDDVRALAADSSLARLLETSDGVLEFDAERASRGAIALPPAERYWLTDTGARLLLPLKGAGRQVIGLLLLGEKKSELPFSNEDRALLSAVASAASLSLAYLSVSPSQVPELRLARGVAQDTEPAAICMTCGLLDEPDRTECSRCGSLVVRAPVPRLLAGKFRLIERIGEGGMGVVFRARDLTLNRDVAIKTLPQVSPDRASRLRREARAMAAITHPNLALIYGGESWNGMPILIVEYLAGGTLADRLRAERLTPNDSLRLGVALADVVAALHRVGILHGDIKPSNIGFTAEGVPKLLDFGLARLLSAAGESELPTTDELRWAISQPPPVPAQGLRAGSLDGRIIGTPLYLSPEAVAGLAPDPTFDVWSICVVLFESIAGTNPAMDTSIIKTLHRIERCDFPDLKELVPGTSAQLSTFFRAAFSANPAERPRNAAALRDRLSQSLKAMEVTAAA